VLRADVPEVYGDPAMLLPLIYTPRTEKRFEVGLVPHYVDRDAVRMNDPCVSTIDVLADWQSVIDRIAECETILSSSLHGLIVAEAYGIPALWTTITDGVAGEGFKFRDYYLSTSREPPEPLVWNGALAKMSRCLAEPPRVDTVPLLGAWPRELTF
jgi:pyruvyltransferase